MRGNREEVKTGDKVMKVEEDIFEIKTTERISLIFYGGCR